MKPLTSRQIATILAALRYWQSATVRNGIPPITEHFGRYKPLDEHEIDVLCERVNVDAGIHDAPEEGL